jgi:1,4-alpha-glucan branching enzyme
MTRVRFALDAPQAKAVQLVGDFTEWEANPRPMRRNRAGAPFVAILPLPPGTYEYKFLVDGEWVEDPAAPSVENRYGTRNSQVVVAAEEKKATRKR